MVQQSLDSKDSAPKSDCPSSSAAPSSFKPDEDGEPDLCAFCLDRIQDPERLHCNHAFCRRCLQLYREARSWVARSCPICRRSLDGGGVQVTKQFNDDWRLFGFMMVVLLLLSLGPFYLLLLYW
ncbi:E3 ubiquitin-protein ligase RNF125 [Drosophila ficusphila]|uniref:E3 ubiquitin-protein ligase RNF125 n=1 Tax=Drosophila ficusphila TaxID=30025 RepID=UPI0007E5E5B6|nr:E3 ubiquitin-protein ligase RNF125 [Drosophila ficusphila]